ncbi:hypothetical protein EVAR_23971_1 [Eumeta japonica]|uniref:Uncharacterized protein n=1 Tax=Eumeta variegata TaxID=151549 RepID=A0A4C1V217_EUMVA|nr:hypothetical protein EVAR_23971_1 [Eumeta japonica]
MTSRHDWYDPIWPVDTRPAGDSPSLVNDARPSSDRAENVYEKLTGLPRVRVPRHAPTPRSDRSMLIDERFVFKIRTMIAGCVRESYRIDTEVSVSWSSRGGLWARSRLASARAVCTSVCLTIDILKLNSC